MNLNLTSCRGTCVTSYFKTLILHAELIAQRCQEFRIAQTCHMCFTIAPLHPGMTTLSYAVCIRQFSQTCRTDWAKVSTDEDGTNLPADTTESALHDALTSMHSGDSRQSSSPSVQDSRHSATDAEQGWLCHACRCSVAL